MASPSRVIKPLRPSTTHCERFSPHRRERRSSRGCAGASRGVRLDSRQPSSTEVPMRLIGLAVILAVSLTLAPLGTAAAQPAVKVPRVGYLALGSPHSDPLRQRQLEAFRQGLRELGYVEG